jgi:hypothetical protein
VVQNASSGAVTCIFNLRERIAQALAAFAPGRMKAQDRARERRRSGLWQQIRPEKERAARKIGRSREIAIRPQ